MMNKVWPVLILFSFVSAIINKKMPELSLSVIEGGQNAVDLLLRLVSMLCLWGGIMEIAEKAGVTKALSRFMSPLIKLVFPTLKNEHYALEAISMNITANVLGLGNAATPLGIEAMKRLHAADGCFDTASDRMVTFVIINTASVQIIPVTTAALRAKYGSEAPMSILPAVLLASLMSLIVGLIVDKMLRGLRRAAK